MYPISLNPNINVKAGVGVESLANDSKRPASEKVISSTRELDEMIGDLSTRDRLAKGKAK